MSRTLRHAAIALSLYAVGSLIGHVVIAFDGLKRSEAEYREKAAVASDWWVVREVTPRSVYVRWPGEREPRWMGRAEFAAIWLNDDIRAEHPALPIGNAQEHR